MNDAHLTMRIVRFAIEESALPMAPKNDFTRQEMTADDFDRDAVFRSLIGAER